MAEINLLPGELRSKEEKELSSVHKIPRVVKIEMSKPPKEEKLSFFRRLFGRQKKIKNSGGEKPIAPKPPMPENKPVFKKEEKPSLPQNRPPRPLVLPKPMIDYNNKNNGDKAQNFKAGGSSELRPPVLPAASAPKDVDRGEKLADALKSLLEEKKPALPASKPPAVERKVWPAPIKPVKNGKEKKGKKDRPAVIGVNFLAQTFGGGRDLAWRRKFIITGLIGLALVVLIAGVYFGLIIYQKTLQGDIGQLKSRINSLDQQIAGQELEKAEASDLQQRLNLVEELLSRHTYWTKFFGLLEKYTIDEVYYLNFSMAGKDKLVISAVGKDYNSLARQFIAFQQAKDFVKSVRIDSAAADIDAQKAVYKGVKFNINLEFMPDIFLKPAE